MKNLKVISALVLVFAALIAQPCLARQQYPVRVVVVTTFEIGQDQGDTPGEFQAWVTGVPLAETIAFPQGYRALRYNRQHQILAIVTGEGPTHSAASIMGLGMDPRFDLSKAYWVVAGIAGVNPNYSSIGSAAWAEWVVDFDLKYEIDRTEIPSDWPIGYVPLTTSKPFSKPHPPVDGISGTTTYHLNPNLVDWAFHLTADIQLGDKPSLQKARAGMGDHPNGLLPPHILKGDEISGATWWLGEKLNQFNEAWMDYWTEGRGKMVMTAMEDSGVLQALTFLTKAGRADMNRVLILRTGSNFTVPAKGQSPVELLEAENSGDSATNLSGYRPSLDAAYAVGSKVVFELADHWDLYAHHTPGR